jgi:hypothetical protein
MRIGIPKGRRGSVVVAILFFYLTTLLSSVAHSAPHGYHSPADDGQNPGLVAIAPGQQSLYLYLFDGASPSSAGTACVSGSGDEICGWSIHVQLTGPSTIVNFVPETGVVFSFSGTEFRANGLNSMPAASAPVPLRVGELIVNLADTGAVEVLSSESVNASLLLESVPQGDLVLLPEPSDWMLLGSGLGILGALNRHRRNAVSTHHPSS